MLAALRRLCCTTPLCASSDAPAVLHCTICAGQPFCATPAALAAVLRCDSCAATAVLRCTVLQLARCINRDVHLSDVQHGVILSAQRMRYGAAFRILMQGKLGDTSYMAYAMTRRCSVDGNKSNQNAF